MKGQTKMIEPVICSECGLDLEDNRMNEPVYCPNCNCMRCPECGGEMDKNTDSDDLNTYTAGKCQSCDFQCSYRDV